MTNGARAAGRFGQGGDQEALRTTKYGCMGVNIRTLSAIAIVLGMLTTGAIPETHFPSRPISLVVPFPAGGPSDTVARIVADRMRTTLGQPLVIENLSGGGGTTGLAHVVNSKPDGHTLLVGNWASQVGASATFKVGYDVVSDFDPVAMLAVAPVFFLGRSTLPADDMRGLITWLKQNPAGVSAATAGVGSLAHLTCAYFQQKSGTRFLLVPYRGAGPALQDLVAAQVDLLCGIDASAALPFVRSGKVKAYVVMQKTRWTQEPEVPTVDEVGLQGFYVSSWNALWAPKGVPQSVIESLTTAVLEALNDPTVREQLTAHLGQEIPPPELQTPKGLAAFYRSELDKWLPILKASSQ
jgi:tripartite-type tricarboxylate transporter receptor subunit TctC